MEGGRQMFPRGPHRPVPQEHQSTQAMVVSYNIHIALLKGPVLRKVEAGRGTKRERKAARGSCSGPHAQRWRPFCRLKADREMLPDTMLASSSTV